MFNFLKNHPFVVEAFFESSTVVTFAVPKEQLSKLIPECLTLDTFDDKYGFIAVAMVQTKDLRPKGFPKFLGNDFFLIGYRIFVRYEDKHGKNLRGLFILKSETDKWSMKFLGSLFTKYDYSKIDVARAVDGAITTIASSAAGFKISYDTTYLTPQMPGGSPFVDWKQARKFAGPLPFTFSYNQTNQEVLIVEGQRENWIPRPLKIIDYKFHFLSELGLEDVLLANAFIIENIPYQWKKGRTETWTK